MVRANWAAANVAAEQSQILRITAEHATSRLNLTKPKILANHGIVVTAWAATPSFQQYKDANCKCYAAEMARQVRFVRHCLIDLTPDFYSDRSGRVTPITVTTGGGATTRDEASCRRSSSAWRDRMRATGRGRLLRGWRPLPYGERERRWLTNIFASNAMRWWLRVTSIADTARTTTSNFAPSADLEKKRRQIGLN